MEKTVVHELSLHEVFQSRTLGEWTVSGEAVLVRCYSDFVGSLHLVDLLRGEFASCLPVAFGFAELEVFYLLHAVLSTHLVRAYKLRRGEVRGEHVWVALLQRSRDLVSLESHSGLRCLWWRLQLAWQAYLSVD